VFDGIAIYKIEINQLCRDRTDPTQRTLSNFVASENPSNTIKLAPPFGHIGSERDPKPLQQHSG
jgi:hypothetical protein